MYSNTPGYIIDCSNTYVSSPKLETPPLISIRNPTRSLLVLTFINLVTWFSISTPAQVFWNKQQPSPQKSFRPALIRDEPLHHNQTREERPRSVHLRCGKKWRLDSLRQRELSRPMVSLGMRWGDRRASRWLDMPTMQRGCQQGAA